MSLAAAIDRIFGAIDAGQPICELMRADELAAGYTVVKPGDAIWLSPDDWDDSVVVSKNDRIVRLVAILARNPGHGALRRTVAGIIEDGLTPQIVEPTNEMRATCKRWGWRCRHIGRGIESQEIWYPKRSSLDEKETAK